MVAKDFTQFGGQVARQSNGNKPKKTDKVWTSVFCGDDRIISQLFVKNGMYDQLYFFNGKFILSECA
ncbi:hypothetical protein C2869_16855 [Saccharobesus litoralis]|uniref:Uncharacterized protein n=1 Tax=Saccharobesus litoralis TaxID=2172099 RepID=A0A2S0VV63_9ALTE|nr:hypothetical protein C2869_16855 [Saccharobesus litoralis]